MTKINGNMLDETEGRSAERSPEPIVASASFDARSGTIILPLPNGSVDVPEAASNMAAEGFIPKQELHMTVIGFEQGTARCHRAAAGYAAAARHPADQG